MISAEEALKLSKTKTSVIIDEQLKEIDAQVKIAAHLGIRKVTFYKTFYTTTEDKLKELGYKIHSWVGDQREGSITTISW